MSTKSVMILGAGRGQLGLVQAARSLGVRTVVATLPSKNAPGIPQADRVVWTDIADSDAIERAAREHHVCGIATACMDTGLPALGRVCDSLGLPGLTQKAARMCADKSLMKRAFESGGVTTARYRRVGNTQELWASLRDLGLPVIVKATDLQGSQGIAIVQHASEAQSGFEFAMSATSRDHVIVEQLIEGAEFGAQALVHGGEVVFVLPHNDEVHLSKTPVPIGHSVPLSLGGTIPDRASAQTVKAIQALGLDNCAVNIDLIAQGDEVYVLEVSGRMGANGLPEMVSQHYGVNYYETVVLQSLGEDPTGPFRHPPNGLPAVAARMVTAPGQFGIIKEIAVDRLAVPDADYALFRGPGDPVNGFTSSADCIGQITVSATHLDLALRKLDAAREAISLSVV